MDPGSTKPSWRSGNNHGFCVTGGRSPIASEPTPSPRLWATPPGATPTRLCEHTMRVHTGPSKPELSTWLGIGTFYLAPTGRLLDFFGMMLTQSLAGSQACSPCQPAIVCSLSNRQIGCARFSLVVSKWHCMHNSNDRSKPVFRQRAARSPRRPAQSAAFPYAFCGFEAGRRLV
jgi:predicted Fe-S protein YdhL (DUF1289 family)